MSKRRTKATKTANPKRLGKVVSVWVPDELRDALDELLLRTRRHLTAEVIIALEKHLTDEGMWPRQKATGGGH